VDARLAIGRTGDKGILKEARLRWVGARTRCRDRIFERDYFLNALVRANKSPLPVGDTSPVGQAGTDKHWRC